MAVSAVAGGFGSGAHRQLLTWPLPTLKRAESNAGRDLPTLRRDLEVRTYSGLAGDERAVPDFYAEYTVRRGKFVAVPETAALCRPGPPGASEQEIKAAWLRQVFDPDPEAFPRLRMINWFEWRKPASEIGAQIVDWRATSGDPALLSDFSTAAERWRDFR